MKGYPAAAALMALREMAGGSLSKKADLIAGTSIGGILASLAACDIPGDWTDFFTQDGPKIFKGRFFRHWPKYSGAAIEERLQNRFGNRTLKDCKTRLLVTALDRTNQVPFMFKSYDPSNLPQGTDTPLWQVCRATSSAQRYFPAFDLGGKFMWDGGNIANNPSVCAFFERRKLGLGDNLKILSIGCGEDNVPVVKWPQWIQDLLLTIGLQFDTSQDEVDYQLTQELGKNYRCIQPVFSGPVALDDASDYGLAWLRSAATIFVQKNQATIEWFLAD